MRASLLFVLIAGASAVAAATACSTPPVATEADIKNTTQASSVTVQMLDAAGNELGSCSGTLIAKDLVLTAGHCTTGVASWAIDARGANAKSESKRAVTPWKAFGSKLSHPDHSDLALLVLSKPIVLDKYPSIATTPLSSGTKALHFHRTSAAAGAPTTSTLSLTSGRAQGFRLDYLAKIADGGFLDTGGAVVDPTTGDIHGVVSGKGEATGLLHIARIDNFGKWLKKAQACVASTSLSPRGYPGSSSSSGGSSGWGGSSSGGWGGYGGGGSALDAAAPPPYGGTSSGGVSSSGGASSSGTLGDGGASSSGGASSGGASSGGASSGGASSGGSDSTGGTTDTTCPSTPTCEGSACPGTEGPGSPSALTPGGGDGSEGASSSGATASGGNPPDGTSSSGGAGGASSGGTTTSGGTTSGSTGATPTDICPGPPNCPDVDSPTCEGPACGGCGGVAGCADTTIDYGSCASCGTAGTNGTSPVLR